MLSNYDEPLDVSISSPPLSKECRVSLVMGMVDNPSFMKDQNRVPTDLATDFDDEAVVGLLPNLRYQRAMNRFVGENAIDATKLTQICFELDLSSCFLNCKRHDLPQKIDKGYITFHDYKSSRYNILSFHLNYSVIIRLTVLYFN